MDEKPTKRGGAVVSLVLVAVLVLLPLLYVLSVGPFVWLVYSGRLAQPWISAGETVYWPLDWTASNVPVAGPAIRGYAEWWLPQPALEPYGRWSQPVRDTGQLRS